MDFKEKLEEFIKKINLIKNNISTEEATKTSIIMPFFQLLGYDIFNPLEFIPEYIADVGIKKGEKVDYAILKNNEPMILIETKAIKQKLEKHSSQLFRYYATTKAKFAILTNGLQYWFYTDTEEINKMDKEPFLIIDFENIKDKDIIELKKFTKEVFDVNLISKTAEIIKYETAFKKILEQQLLDPTDDFLKVFISSVYKGVKTQSVLERFRPILKKSINDFLNENINSRIKTVLDSKIPTTKFNPNIITTDEELEAYALIKKLLKNTIETKDISYKDTESYFGILYQENTRKWICRLILKDTQKVLIIPDKNKNQIKYTLNSIEDIKIYKNELIKVLKRYTNDNIEYIYTTYGKIPKPIPYKVNLNRIRKKK